MLPSRILLPAGKWGWSLRRPAAAAALLLLLSNGPVVRFATGVMGRPGHWNDWAVWPFFAAAAAASGVLAWAVWLSGRRLEGPADGDSERYGTGGIAAEPVRPPLSRTAAFMIAWYSAVAVVSSLWSAYPGATLWRSTVYLGLALLALALAWFSAEELATTLVLAASAAVTGSLVVIALLHEEGVDHQENWIGLFTNRNSLAPLAALGVIAGLRWLEPKRASMWDSGLKPQAPSGPALWRRAWGAALVVASLTTLAGAGSRTAWLGLVVSLTVASAIGIAAVGAAPARGVPRWQVRALTAAASTAVLAVCAVAAGVAWNVPTFAQRRTLWGLVWERVLERPWGGHGFFAFWEVPELVQGHVLLQRGSAHNSLFETALGMGILGSAPFVVLAVLAAVNAGRGLWLRPSADTWMWAALTVFVLLENVTESFVLWFSYIWVLLLVAALRRPSATSATALAEP